MAVGSRARMQMTMRAEIERDGTITTDAYGHPEVPAFAALATVACRIWSNSRREINDTKKYALVEEIRCAMPLGTDVTEKDRIALVKDRLGVTIWDGPLRIDAIQYKHTHVEMNLRRIQTSVSA